MKDKYMTSGEIIRKYRIMRGYSQQKFADMIPMSQSGLCRLETSRNIGTKSVIRIAHLLNIDPNLIDPHAERNAINRADKKIPVLQWTETQDWIDDKPIPVDPDREFISPPIRSLAFGRVYALKVIGESMREKFKNESFDEGSYLIVNPDKKEKSGDFIIYKASPDTKSPKLRKIIIKDKVYVSPLSHNYHIESVKKSWRSLGVVTSNISLF